jgi:hypothetical protein
LNTLNDCGGALPLLLFENWGGVVWDLPEIYKEKQLVK